MRMTRKGVILASIVVVTVFVAAGVGAAMRGTVAGGGHLGGGPVTGIRARGGIYPRRRRPRAGATCRGAGRIKLPARTSSLIARFSGEADCEARGRVRRASPRQRPAHGPHRGQGPPLRRPRHPRISLDRAVLPVERVGVRRVRGKGAVRRGRWWLVHARRLDARGRTRGRALSGSSERMKAAAPVGRPPSRLDRPEIPPSRISAPGPGNSPAWVRRSHTNGSYHSRSQWGCGTSVTFMQGS